MKKNIEKLKTIFKENGQKDFITCAQTNTTLTYETLQKFSLKLASNLLNKNIKKGDFVGVLSLNCIEYILIYFACMHVGATVIPINYRLHEKEIASILSENKIDLLFLSTECLPNPLTLKDLVKEIYSFTPTTKNAEKNLIATLNQQEKSSLKPFDTICDDDLFAIMFTSGTTGKPKGVMITYKKIIANGLSFIEQSELTPDLLFYNYLDLAYLGGLYNLMLIPFLSQASIVLDRTFSPQTAISFWQNIEKFKVNTLWLVPSIASMILFMDRSDLGTTYCKKHMKKVLIGTAPVSEKLKKQFEQKYSVTLYENYGLSETFFIATNSAKNKKNKGVGKVFPECTVNIVDDNGKTCKTYEPGNIQVQTPYLMNGYYNEVALNTSVFQTGDLGYLDEDGFLFITDRKKDIIIRGGINISPREIENIIAQHHSIEDVAVIGKKDDLLGEEIIAFVQTQTPPTIDEIKFFCAQKLAPFKIPSKIIFKKNLPRSLPGKIQKNVLKEMLEKTL